MLSTCRDIAASLTYKLLQEVIHAHSLEQILSTSKTVTKGALSEPGKAKIRYVGGMCIAKTRKHLCNTIHENLGNPIKSARDKVRIAQTQLKFIYSLEASLEEKKKASTESTFEEIERRQNVTQCLTYINEKCFSFFLLLNLKVSDLMTIEAFQKGKENIFENCKDALKKDKELCSVWAELCNKEIKTEDSYYIFEHILRRYLMVCQKQFLKDAKSYFNVTKKKRHREEIQKVPEKCKKGEQISIKFIEMDATENKEGSHLRLKLNCLENSNYFNNKDYTKNDLLKLCDAYGIKVSKTWKKDQIARILRENILAAQHMSNPVIFSNAIASTSEEPSKKKSKRLNIPSKGKGKGKGKSSKRKYYCGLCNEIYHATEDWVQCDDCSKWYHRVCAGLETDEAWERVQDTEVEWICHSCKN